MTTRQDTASARSQLPFDIDREELDKQYNNRARVSDYLSYFERWKAWSASTRSALRCSLNLPYGASAKETLDFFPASTPDAPVNLFIHGGYWQSLDKEDFSFVAEGMVANGVSCAVVNYGLAPDVTMDEITRQNRAAVVWLWRNARELGIDPRRIYVSGHSAGGHLVGMLLATDWAAFGEGLPADLLRAGCAISGLFDLEPIRLCYLNEVLGMDADMARRNSPVYQTYKHPAALIVALGGLESNEYHRQAAMMRETWFALGYPLSDYVPMDRHHFSLVDPLHEASSHLTMMQVEAIKGL